MIANVITGNIVTVPICLLIYKANDSRTNNFKPRHERAEFTTLLKKIVKVKENCMRIAKELHELARKNYCRRIIDVFGKNDLWKTDLVELIPHYKK